MSIHLGATRVVICVHRWAFKLPRWRTWREFIRGMLANDFETTYYRAFRLPQLCPVLWSAPFGLCTIMRRAELMREDDPELAFFSGVCKVMCIPCERKFESFGRIGDKLVVIDYGHRIGLL